mmetsp:Transcript_4967/g.10330  ORF Transcript_4967/g.10330 Transcript_4967/m.10330 type:complete len:321 (+) Transcript_4967:78-1040(+)
MSLQYSDDEDLATPALDSVRKIKKKKGLPCLPWQRQLIIVVIALLGAWYQVRKSTSLFQKQDELAMGQLELAGSHMAAMASDDLQFFIGQTWHPQKLPSKRDKFSGTQNIPEPPGYDPSKPGARRVILAVGPSNKQEADETEAVLYAELFVDPVQRRKHSAHETGRKHSQRRNGGRSRHQRDLAGSQKPSSMERSLPKQSNQGMAMLGMKIFDKSMDPIAAELQRLGLVERVVQHTHVSEVSQTSIDHVKKVIKRPVAVSVDEELESKSVKPSGSNPEKAQNGMPSHSEEYEEQKAASDQAVPHLDTCASGGRETKIIDE